MDPLGELKFNGKYLQEEQTSGYTVKGMHVLEGCRSRAAGSVGQ